MTLAELMKLDIEYRLARGAERPLQEYIREYPELGPEPPADLLYEDCYLRLHAGRSPDPDDYFRRFPARAAELALLGATVAARSTSVLGARPPAGLVRAANTPSTTPVILGGKYLTKKKKVFDGCE